MANKRPLVIVNGRFQELQPGDTLNPLFSSSLISTNWSLYVASTGNDYTGDGSFGNPWATIGQALIYLSKFGIAQGVTVYIYVAAGSYTITAPTVVNHPQGSQIQIVGATATTSMTAVVSFTTPVGGSATAVITVASTASMAINSYILIPAPTGTASQHFWNLAGCHKITGISGNNVTITVKSYAPNAAVASTATVGSVFVLQTVLNFTSSDGFQLCDGMCMNYSLGLLTGLCLVGTTGYVGVRAGNLNVSYTGFVTWGNPLQCSNHATASVTAVAASGCQTGFRAYYGSYLTLTNSAVNGCTLNQGLTVQYGSSVYTNCLQAVGNNNDGAWLQNLSTANFYGSLFCDNRGNGIRTNEQSSTETNGNCNLSYNTSAAFTTTDLSTAYNCTANTMTGNTSANSPLIGSVGNNGSYNFATT